MKLTPSQLNKFSMVKLPSAWFCGVRVVAINDTSCTTTVKHRWINQNPFNSMFWAVQGMAAELATGAIVIGKIKKEQAKIFKFLPFVFTFILAGFAAGLVLYWSVNNILSISQQWIIQRKILAKNEKVMGGV